MRNRLKPMAIRRVRLEQKYSGPLRYRTAHTPALGIHVSYASLTLFPPTLPSYLSLDISRPTSLLVGSR